MKRIIKLLACICCATLLNSCGDSRVVIYTNADDEAIQAMEEALDGEGFAGKYVFNSFSTSELGGRLMVEGKDLEADLVTLSSYYIDSARKKHAMFRDLDFTVDSLVPSPSCSAPVTAQEGTLFYNTKVMQETGLPVPASLKDLARPEYKGHISITNIRSSSTAWLFVQALVDAYGEEEAGRIMQAIIDNAGPHFENSGSAPLKKVRAGEVAIGFGLRQQAVLDKERGLPVEYVDPAEGNFILEESVCVVDHGQETKPEAMRIAETIAKKARPGILRHYPVALYKGEETASGQTPGHAKRFPEPLTLELLKKHESLIAGQGRAGH